MCLQMETAMIRSNTRERETFREYRLRLIRETEMFLRYHLQLNKRSHEDDRGNDSTSPVAPERPDPQASPQCKSLVQGHSLGLGTLIQVQGDDDGHLGQEQIDLLRRRLRYVVGRHGDVLLDLSAVRSATKVFIRMLEKFQQQLNEQKRYLFLDGLDHVRILRFDR